MAERPDRLSEEEASHAFDDIVTENHDLQYLGMAQSVGNFETIAQTNLDNVSQYVQAHYEPNAIIPQTDFDRLQADEIQAFADMVRTVLNEQSDMDDRLATIAGVYAGAGAARAKLFNELIPTEDPEGQDFMPWDIEAVKIYTKNIPSESKDQDDLVSKLCQHFREDLYDDYSLLQVKLEQVAAEKGARVTSQTESQKSVREHLLDVAKITAGVLGALAVERMVRRKK